MPITESFTYDKLNRLTTATLNGSATGAMDYDAYGRILSKTEGGQTVFSNATYDDSDKPHAIRQAEATGNVLIDPHTIEYTMFDKVKHISSPAGTIDITYGYDHERTKMVRKVNDIVLSEKRYIGNCEIEGVSMRTYISGPMGVFAVYEVSDYKSGDDGKNGGYEGLRYIHKDHLGSWTTITDEEGNIEQELSFDAWGNLRDPETWHGFSQAEPVEAPMFDRGYTGHEHMTAFGLINMNGRCYDPTMSSFLSVDEYVQDPSNAQNFNRYAYCLNNPLKYTDPSGWFYQGGSHSVASDENARRLVVNSELYAEQYERFFGQKENHKAYYMEGEEQKGVGGAGGGSESPDDDWVYDKRTGKYDWNDYANDEETTPDGYEYVGPSKDDVNAHYIEENGLLLYYLFGPEFGDISTWPGEISAPDGLVDFEMNLDATPTNGWEVVVLAAMNVLYSTINSPYSLFTGKTIGGRVLNTSERESAFADVASNCISMTKPVGQTIKITQTGRQGLKQFIKASEKAGVKFENKNEARIALKINNTLRKNQSCIKSHDRMMNSINYSNAIRKELQK